MSEADRHRWSRRMVLLVTTAVVLAGGVAVLAAALAGSGTTTPSGGRGGTGAPRAITERAVARLLAAEPALPGATRVNAAPVAALASPESEPASNNLVRRTAWWLVPGGVDRALAYVAAHRPAGVVASGSQTTHGGGPTIQALTFDATGPQWRRPSTYAEFELAVAVTADGNRTALRVDAEAIWLPARSAAARIPDSVTAVDVVERRGDGSIALRRTLAAAAARRLAAIVNALPTEPPGEYSCPMDDGSTDRLTFRAPGAATLVEARVTGCAEVKVGPTGPGRPVLTGGRALHAAIARELKPSR